jgi:hypothetical protein
MKPLYRQLKWHRLSFVNVTLLGKVLIGVKGQIIQGITDEAYNSRYWVGQIEILMQFNYSNLIQLI